MIKTIYIFVALTFITMPTMACNICGGGGGASYNGILPQYKKNVITLRQRYRSFDQYNLQSNGTKLKSTFQYQSIELWGRIYLKDRIQFFFTVPYTVNTLTDEASGASTLNGIGDMTVQCNYNVINTTFDTTRTRILQHNLLMGGGVKLPTGKYQQRNKNDLMYAPNFQAGSGAYSYFATIIYTLRYKKVGVNADMFYNYNTENELDYAFGNQFVTSLAVFAWLKKGKTTFLPNVGVIYETLEKDISNGYYNPLTGGYAINLNVGTDVFYKKIFGGITVQQPISQAIGSDDVVYKLRYMLNVGYMF